MDVPAATTKGRIMLRAAGPGCTIHYLTARDNRRTALRWYTSGIPGARTPDVARAVSAVGGAADVYRAVAADLITVAIGVNDSIHADEQALAGSAAALETLVRNLLDRQSACVALMGAVPVREDYQPGPWRVRDAYRDLYRPVAEKFGIPLLEIEPAWGGYGRAARDGLVADHVHPNVAGHAAIARGWVNLLNGSAPSR
ncbi:SGNH/GDSL hydrolase family protein [Kineococcus sp. NBC_00420]|uniref:SGNH/GDSL hydrolase family protein n=1 Tax=Kineococcus sp. NBC_00420 TaxID=2903564 RepID=UPI002E1D0520